MSLSYARAAKLPTITGNVDYEPWKKAVDVLLFSKRSGGVSLETMSRKDLLDITYFGKQEEFQQYLQRLYNNENLHPHLMTRISSRDAMLMHAKPLMVTWTGYILYTCCYTTPWLMTSRKK
jgi:hypothetical protein